jgi:REP element-mobilizing transposase RayT
MALRSRCIFVASWCGARRSYFISSVGGANLETVKRYIEGTAREYR